MSFPPRPNPVFSDEYRCLVNVLVLARRQAGLSQRALARALGRSQSHICKIELGERRVDALEFYHIARACGCEPEELYGRFASRVAALERGEPPARLRPPRPPAPFRHGAAFGLRRLSADR